LFDGRQPAPRDLLGPHPVEGRADLTRVRAFLPQTQRAWLVGHQDASVRPLPMRRTHAAGLFEAYTTSTTAAGYRLRIDDAGSGPRELHDPYAFPAMLTDYDLHLLGEGRHWKSYEKLGSQLREVDGVRGVNFAVWAPNAAAVSVVGDFNGWDGRIHQMHQRFPSGIWELFVPPVELGAVYKYRVQSAEGTSDGADGYGIVAFIFRCNAYPPTDVLGYAWCDFDLRGTSLRCDWLAGRTSNLKVRQGSRRPLGKIPARCAELPDV
jgi:1,4-alpha-glucan branching enzyme